MLFFWASSEGKCLVYCLLHWISGVQVICLSIWDEQVFSLSATCLLEESTSLTWFGPLAELLWSLSFQSVSKTPFKVSVNL